MSIAQFSAMSEPDAHRFMAGLTEPQPARARLAELVGDRNVLDVGCGKGAEVSRLYTPEQYLGVDCSVELVRIARREHPGYRFVVRDALDVTGFFEVAIIKAVLEHLPPLEARAVYEHMRARTDVLYVCWHTEPGVEHLATYDGELGTMQQNRHDRARFGGMVRRERSGVHVIWEVR